MARELTNDIFYVGAVDFRVRNFHGYSTERGSSYNAYLIVDDEVTVVDTVKAPFKDDFLNAISEVVDFKAIKNIVVNHSEPDHSGALPFLIEKAPQAKIFADKMGATFIKKHYGEHIPVNVVSIGDELNIGKRTLQFVETPMAHWPDNMVTLIKDEGILFSNDIFGQHIASYERFDDEYDRNIILSEARKYYANIIMPYKRNALKAYESLGGLNLKMILPSHGLAFRKDLSLIIDEYNKLIGGINKRKAVVIYDTMWTSTEKLARAIAKGFVSAGIETRITCLQEYHISDIITEVMDAEYVAVGSPTLNNGMMPTVSAMLCYMKGLLPPENGKKYVAFGSYGWGGQSIGLVETELKAMKMEQLLENIKVQFVPSADTLKEIADRVSDSVKE